MKEDIQINPASTISLEVSPTLRIFSTRSTLVNPKSLFSPCLILSPSRVIVWRPIACNFFSKTLAIEDFPEPDRPVNQTKRGR